MESKNQKWAEWVRKYNYREAASINSCELCVYTVEVDRDGKRGVEALMCSAGAEDTGVEFPVEFTAICDLFESDLLENKPDLD